MNKGQSKSTKREVRAKEHVTQIVKYLLYLQKANFYMKVIATSFRTLAWNHMSVRMLPNSVLYIQVDCIDWLPVWKVKYQRESASHISTLCCKFTSHYTIKKLCNPCSNGAGVSSTRTKSSSSLTIQPWYGLRLLDGRWSSESIKQMHIRKQWNWGCWSHEFLLAWRK